MLTHPTRQLTYSLFCVITGHRNLFKVGVMVETSDKLRASLGRHISVAKSALDYRYAPYFDREALDLVDERYAAV